MKSAKLEGISDYKDLHLHLHLTMIMNSSLDRWAFNISFFVAYDIDKDFDSLLVRKLHDDLLTFKQQ